MRRNGVARTLSLSLSQPTFYYHQTDFALSLKVTVTASNDPSCPTGSTGRVEYSGSLDYGLVGPPPPGKPNKFTLCEFAGPGLTQHVHGSIASGAEGGGGD